MAGSCCHTDLQHALESQLRYDYITTGESYILVRIRSDEPTTTEYLLIPKLKPLSREPSIPERAEQSEAAWLSWLAGTPLSRLSCLALLSMFADGNLTEPEMGEIKASESMMIWRTPRHREQSLESKSMSLSFRSTTSGNTKDSGDQELTEQGHGACKQAYSPLDQQHGCKVEQVQSSLTPPVTPASESKLGPRPKCIENRKRACPGDTDEGRPGSEVERRRLFTTLPTTEAAPGVPRLPQSRLMPPPETKDSV